MDNNANQKITSADAAFSTLRVWHDLNANGVTDAGELKTLTELGITELSVVSNTPAQDWIDGSAVRATATFKRVDGTIRKIVQNMSRQHPVLKLELAA